ncbi:hypothetical protein BKA56DRAFT_591215 [Ilyonectria sp. MPI-CAGE-AT-0026]|nr:hypothetical protein BKA56DRAFT_591215 [Ilyonectria sp. MPI-CAGE-AT-0026]
MSGFEVTGIVLGVLPIVISAISDYKQKRGLLASFIKSRGLLDDLLHELRNHQRNFYFDILDLLREAKVQEILVADDPPQEECVKILQDSRTGIQVRDYMGHVFGDFLEILTNYEECLKKITSNLHHIVRPANVPKDDLIAIVHASQAEPVSMPFKVKVKFSIDRDGLDALVKDLGTERYSLGKLIKRVKSKREWEARQPTDSSATLALEFTKVGRSATLLYQAACKCWACHQHDLHSVLLRLDHSRIRPIQTAQDTLIAFRFCFPIETDILQEVEIAAHYADLLQTPTKPQAERAGTLLVPSITITACQESIPACIWIESICEDAQRARTRGRVLTLRLMSDALELLEGDRPHEPYNTCTTLAEFLRDTAENYEARMLPVDQTMLALDVVSSVLQLRPTVWCTTHWNSTTIKFPRKLTDGAYTTVFTPYLEQTVEDSVLQSYKCLPDLNIEVIQSTMLELAILLLEILHHKSLETWAEKYGKGRMCSDGERMAGARNWLRMSSEERTERLLPDQVKSIQGCLDYSVKSNLAWDRNFQSCYCENVIKPLQQLTSGC